MTFKLLINSFLSKNTKETEKTKKEIKIDNFIFIKQPSKNSEEYKILFQDRIIGYVRLKYGKLICYFPEKYRRIIYFADNVKGENSFVNNEERMKYLEEITESIKKEMENTKKPKTSSCHIRY